MELNPAHNARAVILVADDDAQVRAIVVRLVAPAGYAVLEAADGDEVLQLLRTHRCDMLVTDLAMPNREGLETIRAVRRAYPAVRIIAMSGLLAGTHEGSTMLNVAKGLGADAAIEKVDLVPSLLPTIERLLR